MTEVKGKANIVARVICDSISHDGVRLTTFECEYPRIVLSELNTHRMLSRNSASSRAIPFEKMLKQLNGRPVRFGAANKGMQDTGEDHFAEVSGPDYCSEDPADAWNDAREDAVAHSLGFYNAGYHKQVYNRLLEPFQMIKTVISATEMNNFFHLRLDVAADPTIYELARCMKEAMEQSVPQQLQSGEWHLPYLFKDGRDYYLTAENSPCRALLADEAIKVSAARCAAVSFRNENYGLEKCLEVYERLVGDERVHASALEHQATPMARCEYDGLGFSDDFPGNWQEGVTHADAHGRFWSGNFRGWIQHRQLVPNHVKEG